MFLMFVLSSSFGSVTTTTTITINRLLFFTNILSSSYSYCYSYFYCNLLFVVIPFSFKKRIYWCFNMNAKYEYISIGKDLDESVLFSIHFLPSSTTSPKKKEFTFISCQQKMYRKNTYSYRHRIWLFSHFLKN